MTRLTPIRTAPPGLTANSPELVLENHHGFNLIAYQGQVFALAAGLGSIDLGQLTYAHLQSLRRQGVCFVSDSIEAAKTQVAQATPYWPDLIEINYGGYNLVAYRGRFYAV